MGSSGNTLSADAAMGDRHQRAILEGDFLSLPVPERGGVRVFLCADPLDSEWERAALRSDVYPRLREHCRRTYGREFQVLDGYHGLRHDDLYSTKVREKRMKLLEECIKSSSGPCFVALIGEEYGKPCLPASIHWEEFEKIVHTAEAHGVSTKILESWYMKDENGIPPVYSLVDEEEALQYMGRQRKDNTDWTHQAFQEMRSVFDVVVPLCVQKQILEEDRAHKYFSSALDEELNFILQSHPNAVLERCICYIHKVPFKAYQKERGQTDPINKAYYHSFSRLCHLRDDLIPSLAHNHGLHVYSTTTTCDIKVGYTKEKRRQYIEGLCKQFYEDIVALIDNQVIRNPERLKIGMEDILEHLSLCNMYSDLKHYELAEAEAIKSYILHDGASKPLVVVGEPGCGKTVLLASCAKKVQLWLSDQDPILAVRFVSSYGESLSLSRLLLGLCQQLSDIYTTPVNLHPDNIEKLKECLHRLLLETSKKRPLVLIIDSLNHLKHCERGGDILEWLPSLLPKNTKIILSVSQEKLLDLKSQFSERVIFIEMKPTRKECNDNLKISLLKEKRKITSGQQVFVNRSLTIDPSPLQVHLVFKEVMGWKSHQDVNEHSLSPSIQNSIERLFYKLELKYGYEFVFRALSYITLSRSGIAEAELVDVLSSDNTVLAQLYDVNHNVSTLRVPDWLVANILLDLRGCVGSRTVTGSRLIWWTNKFYQQIVVKRYLNNQEVINIHRHMCDYFSGRWTKGMGKSMTIKQNADLQQESTSKVYIDRQLPSQPWSFAGLLGTKQMVRGNLRKAFDLPYHLKECRKIDNLYDVLMSQPYYKILLNSGHLYALLGSLEDAATLTGRKELSLISDILQETRCLLIDNPDAFDAIVQSKMMPLLPLYPSLFRLTKQIFGESTKSSPLVILNSALFRLPSIKADFPESSEIVSILDAKTKAQLIVIFKNGHIYTWTVGNKASLEYQLSLSTDIEITGATLDSEGQYLSVSTSTQLIILLDYYSWTILNEISGFVVEAVNHYLSNMILFVSLEKIQKVGLFDILSGVLLKELTFAQKITYFGCVGRGRYLAVGQLNRLILHTTQNVSQEIVLPIDLSKHVIADVYLHHSYVIVFDKYGRIRVWDIANLSKPRSLEEISHHEEEDDEVLSTELVLERLLVHKSTSFDVWQISTWQKVSFRSHQGKLTCCTFSDHGDAVIAGVESISSLFVWNIQTGQLVSKINLESQVMWLVNSLHLKVLGAVTSGNSIVFWDLKSLTIPTACIETRRPFKSVTVCPLGGRAYTSDGSDMVCKWDIPKCRISALFQHRGVVVMTEVTPNGALLITSEAYGEVYVWETDSGINSYRIQSSPISQILITPNSHCVVTLCEDGGSRVWRALTGCTVCKVHTSVSQAIISPESTFVIGLNNNRLLAISLWSGDVGKEFHCSDKSIVAFQCLTSHPDFIILLTSTADLYTWNVVEESICHQFKLPVQLSHPLTFQSSFNGDYLVITSQKRINVINTLGKKCYTLYTPITILPPHFTKDGNYIIYICHGQSSRCDCDFHVNPTINILEVGTGKKLTEYHLGKMPCFMSVSDDDAIVCVGFEDGTLGLYLVAGKWKGNARLKECLAFGGRKESVDIEQVHIYQGKPSADIIWNDSISSVLSLGGSSDVETVFAEE
ncbi:NACHT and WD repeat domain-containing protein 2-like [Gastrophryne carolinensis]